MSGENVKALPIIERNEMEAALAMLDRIMPQEARRAKTMRDEFVKAGFTDDESLQLVAYALFR